MEKATSKDWLDIMKNRSKLRMHELIERLGLRAKWSQNKRGKTNFESALVRELVTDMGDIVATLPKESDELLRFLSTEHSLNAPVDALMRKHGTAIWGEEGDREHLISVGEPGVEDGVYPRDLHFENEEDQEQIKNLLHWWLGMKAINVILARERLDRERKKKEESKRARIEAEHSSEIGSSSFVSPMAGQLNTNVSAMSTGEPARHMQFYQVENVTRGSPMSTLETVESPIVLGNGGLVEASHFGGVIPNAMHGAPTQSAMDGVWDWYAGPAMNGSRHGSISSQVAINPSSWSAVSAAQAAGSRRASQATEGVTQSVAQSANCASWLMHRADISQIVSDLTPDIPSTTGTSKPTSENGVREDRPYRGLDVDTLRALRAYIYREETTVQWDEDSLLRRLETTWREGIRCDYNRVLDNVPVFIARERAILTWIELKRHLADLDRADKRWSEEGHSAPEIERRIQQHRTLMSAVRELLRNYEDIPLVAGVGGADNDELLRQAFVVLAGEKYAVELQWRSVEFAEVMHRLADHLDAYRRREEEDGEGVYFVG